MSMASQSLKQSYWQGWVKSNNQNTSTTSTAGGSYYNNANMPSATATTATANSGSGQSGGQYGLGYPTNSTGKRVKPAYGGGPSAKKKKTGGSKMINPNSMTPAALVHQLFNGIEESFEHNPTSKKYRCTLVVMGTRFEMEANNKKEAKQKAAELALRTLRPDIEFNSPSATVIKPLEDAKCSIPNTFVEQPPIEAPSTTNPIVSNSSVSASVSATATASGSVRKDNDHIESIVDYMYQLIAQKYPGVYNPLFDIIETTSRQLAPNEAHKKEYKCTLTFLEQGKTYTNEGFGKEAQKEIVTRRALVELMGVAKDTVLKITKGIALFKLKPDGTNVAALYQIAAAFRCEVECRMHSADPTYEQKVESVRKNIPAVTPSVAVFKIKDYGENGKIVKFTSKSFATPQEAKEHAAGEALKRYFNVDMNLLDKDKQEYLKMRKKMNLVTPIQILNEKMQKMGKQSSGATYEEIDVDPTSGKHKVKVTVDGQTFIGSGETKKMAKNQAALFAMRTIFKMEDIPKAPKHMPLNKSALPCSVFCYEINEFSKAEYFNMCTYYGIKPSAWFAVFLLVNEKNEKRVLSMAGSSGAVLPGNQFLHSQGSALLHIDAIVLARRSLVRNLMIELELAQQGNDKSIFELGDDALYKIKKNLRLVLYSSHAPDCTYSCEEAPVKSLSYIAFGGYCPAGGSPQTLREIRESDFVRVHSTADKIFKWTHLGVQGSLLSAIMHPLLPEVIIFGMRAPISDMSLGFALYSRLSGDRYPFMLECANDFFEPSSSQPHFFTRGFDGIEMICPANGRSESGAPSRLCKLEMFENFLKVAPHISRSSSYVEAKAHALAYNEAKKVFYETLSTYSWGQWQRMPLAAVDFKLMTADD